MQALIDLFERDRRKMAEQAAAGEAARKQNIQVFEAMWLGLGRDS